MKFSGQSYSNLLFLASTYRQHTEEIWELQQSDDTRKKFSTLALMIQIPLAEINAIFLSSGETEFISCVSLSNNLMYVQVVERLFRIMGKTCLRDQSLTTLINIPEKIWK